MLEPTGWAATGVRGRRHVSPEHHPPPITGIELKVTCPPKLAFSFDEEEASLAEFQTSNVRRWWRGFSNYGV